MFKFLQWDICYGYLSKTKTCFINIHDIFVSILTHCKTNNIMIMTQNLFYFSDRLNTAYFPALVINSTYHQN